MSNNTDKKQESFGEILEHVCVSLIGIAIIASLIVLLFLKHFASCEKPIVIQDSERSIVIINKTDKKIIIIDEHGITKEGSNDKE